MRNFMFTPGTYYVGDLCYVLEDRWDEICDLIFDENNVCSGSFNLRDGTRFALYNTAYGDGSFHDQHGNSYSVDSGSIGVVRLFSIERTADQISEEDLGHVIEFDKAFNCWYDNGKINIGHIIIDTNPEYDED